MSEKRARTGGILPNLVIGTIPKSPKRDMEAEERDDIAAKLAQLRVDFKRRDRLRRDRGRKR